MATRFLKISSNGNKIFKNLVKWQQDFEILTDDSALLHDNFQFFISILGRIFHRVSLSANKSTIKVTRYRPRQPYKADKLDYRYRFGAPDNDNYEVSW